ncbi:MAG: lipopolysaccharide heptosyltransferase II [Candidatus Polarisedimenticolaceae bacterium]|nr:lipopolysaccharide heptosyltransferase II [Candidatus Polarisedimenticolaceae bacterium]
MNSAARILVIGPSWVGDMVMAQSLFKVLKQRQPEAIIDVLAPGWSRPLLDRMPEVSETIEMPLGHGKLALGTRRQLGHALRDRHYDQAILLPNSLKSAIVPFCANIPLRTGWRGEYRYVLLNDIRLLDKQRLTMTVQRFVALALPPDQINLPPIPTPQLTVEASSVVAARTAHQLNDEQKPILALCPGAEFGPAKRWPESYYGQLAAEQIKQGWQVWLFGSEKDQAVCATINEVAEGQCHDLSGRTSLAEAVDLLSEANAVVSNDSGLMHVAAALNRPLVAIYGSSDPNFTPPLNDNARIISPDIDCSPCFKRECPKGHLKCLRDLPVSQVQAALEQLTQ